VNRCNVCCYPWSPRRVTAFWDNGQNVQSSMMPLMQFQSIHVEAHMKSVEAEDKKERFGH
jgi:hypothetical protein